jgi:hypothetical protein
MLRTIGILGQAALAVAMAVPLAASATDYRLSTSGVFDITDGSTDNVLASLVGTPFTFSLIASDDATRAAYSQVEADGTTGWCFCSAPYTATASTTTFSFTSGVPITLYGSNDRVISDDAPVPSGTYDIFEWDGWMHNTTDGGLFGDPGTYPGINYNFSIVLAGAADWFDDGELPSAPLDFSRIVYGTAGIVEFNDGVQVGAVGVDPLLHLVDGHLVGEGMTVSVAAVSSVPEAPSLMMFVGGLGLLALRRAKARRVL